MRPSFASLIALLGGMVVVASCRASPGGDNPADANHNPTGNGDGGVPPTPSALRFAIVGDTRPPNPDDTAHYPTAIITKIWGDVAALSPPVPFAISTGDYMFADTNTNQQNPQLDLYLGARAQYTGPVYAALGNHECTGATASNCGTGNPDGVTKNYTAFMTRMVQPNGFDQPYYVVHVDPPDGSYTAKLVFVACNAWSTGANSQASWLDTALAEPTTYTFVVRHEGTSATTAPCISENKTILARHPYTLLIVGHTHTYAHYASSHEVIVGTGGAPLTSGTDYGYAVVDRRSDGAIQVTAYDYQSGAVVDQFAVHADGTTAN